MACLHGKTQGVINPAALWAANTTIIFFFFCYRSNSCRHLDLAVLCFPEGLWKEISKSQPSCHRLCFTIEPPPSSFILEKREWLTSPLRASPCWRCISQCWPTMSHRNTATACDFPFLGPAIFGSSNYEVSCESPVSHFTPGGNQANCANVLGRRDSCSPVFHGFWPFLLPRVMCSPFLMWNCHAGSERWPDELGLVQLPAGCPLLGRNWCFKGLEGISKGSQRLLLIC